MHKKNIELLHKNPWLFLLVIMSFSACKQSSQSSQKEQVNDENTEVVELDKDFVDFYQKFHADTLMQIEKIKLPLAKNPSTTKNEYWTKENWVTHRPFSDHGGKFGRDFTVIGSIVVEKIYDANGFFNMERRFAKLSDGWRLIYYDVVEQNMMEE